MAKGTMRTTGQRLLPASTNTQKHRANSLHEQSLSLLDRLRALAIDTPERDPDRFHRTLMECRRGNNRLDKEFTRIFKPSAK